LTEEALGIAEKFMIFLTTEWSIMADLFQATAALNRLQANSSEYKSEIAKGHASIDATMSLNISTFNGIISKISEYREISQDAFAFLADDLERAKRLSNEVAKLISSGYSGTVEETISILRSKLQEIGEKVERHLEGKAEGK
jgi:hypothetical protein